ncbi:hypothetical protein Fmac_002732 [Flemingia macrophylla]|uniref:Uncharacterized protein n=1 Tax=Flemingia macrophylla TaxID=520843 RepID=A0ABD1NKS0_9FABA
MRKERKVQTWRGCRGLSWENEEEHRLEWENEEEKADGREQGTNVEANKGHAKSENRNPCLLLPLPSSDSEELAAHYTSVKVIVKEKNMYVSIGDILETLL